MKTKIKFYRRNSFGAGDAPWGFSMPINYKGWKIAFFIVPYFHIYFEVTF